METGKHIYLELELKSLKSKIYSNPLFNGHLKKKSIPFIKKSLYYRFYNVILEIW